jgi:O-acetyl-ADP-ribose deacetylase (regulator of RNase III)
MSVITIKNEDIVNATEQYIVHQTNCCTTYPKGLSKHIFDKFPDANVYKCRNHFLKNYDKPGTIIVRGKIINAMGQWDKSKPKGDFDSYKNRLAWFSQCMNAIVNINGIESLAFPYKIGCGLAGGNWDDYFTTIKRFSNENSYIKFVMYKYTP